MPHNQPVKREAIEFAAMNLCRDLTTNLDTLREVGLEEYWDRHLTPGAREIYRRAARNAHAALVDQEAVKRVAEFVKAADQYRVPERPERVARIYGPHPHQMVISDLRLTDLRALVARPEESYEEVLLAEDQVRS